MLDSTTEGISAEIARIHNVTPQKVVSWHNEGMPRDVEGADAWLRSKGRGRWTKARGGVKTDTAKETERSALGEILRKGGNARPGVLGLYDRACAIEAACFNACLGEPTAANVTAHARARDSVVEAAKQVADHEERCRNLMPTLAVKRAIQAQDGCSVSLLTAMPYALADLLVNQPREAIIEQLQRWGTDTYLKKRRETDPFRDDAPESVDVESVLSEAENEPDGEQ